MCLARRELEVTLAVNDGGCGGGGAGGLQMTGGGRERERERGNVRHPGWTQP